MDRTGDSTVSKAGHLQQLVDKFKHRTALAVRELQQAQQELWALRAASSSGHPPSDLEQDLVSLKKRLLDAEQKVAVLHAEMVASSESAGDSRAALVALQSELTPLLDDVSAVTQHLCAAASLPTASASNARNSAGEIYSVNPHCYPYS